MSLKTIEKIFLVKSESPLHLTGTNTRVFSYQTVISSIFRTYSILNKKSAKNRHHKFCPPFTCISFDNTANYVNCQLYRLSDWREHRVVYVSLHRTCCTLNPKYVALAVIQAGHRHKKYSIFFLPTHITQQTISDSLGVENEMFVQGASVLSKRSSNVTPEIKSYRLRVSFWTVLYGLVFQN